MSNLYSSLLRISTLGCLALATLLGQQPAEPLLDLTRPDPRPPRSGGGTGSGGATVSSDTRIEDPPLRMTLEGVEAGEYPFGSRLVFEVLLENSSDNGFVIPWGGMPELALIQPDLGTFNRPPGYRNGALALTFETADGRNEWIGSNSMVGAPPVPGTVRTLAPGERVRIRAYADLYLRNVGIRGLPASPKTTVRLRASVNLFENPEGVLYLPLFSSNSVEVTLVPPSPP